MNIRMSEKKGSEREVCDDGNSASQRLKTRPGIENKEKQGTKVLGGIGLEDYTNDMR
jgi:hypothetical protein